MTGRRGRPPRPAAVAPQMEQERGNGAASSSGDETSYELLKTLLDKAQMYSTFLQERMDGGPASTSGSCEEEDGKAEAKGNKRKANGARPAARKKAKKEQEEAVDPDGEDEAKRLRRKQEQLSPYLTGGELKEYQIKGVNWMISLFQNGLNGILADQMGLGKTVQTIAFLAHLKSKGMHGPYLICAPMSTLSNWVNEFRKWVPAMDVLMYHAVTKAERVELRKNCMPRQPDPANNPKFPVIVTSYEIAMNDRKFLQQYTWRYLVVDEGHRLKNLECKLIRELKQLKVNNCLLLTGTPLQNNLTELWSLLNFILPEVFTSLTQFQSWFDISGGQTNGVKEEIDEKKNLEIVSKLHLILKPFLLRRLKEDVETNLPKKTEIILYAQMSSHQKEFHDHLINKTLVDYFEKTRTSSGAPFKQQLQNVLMQLRKNCNHPDLLTSDFDKNEDYPPIETMLEQCGKLKLLDRLLKHLRSRGHRVLIFSQMTRMLDILEYYLTEEGFEPCRIDGSVQQVDRQKEINEFNDLSLKRFVFLLSTRAGGLGINLTSADTVIIYDSDWNPHADMQAMDRCHRIGQTRPVHVYRLATARSVECKVLKVANSKLKLEHLVIEKGHFKHEKEVPKSTLQESEILAILRPERDEEEEFVQSADVSEENLLVLLNRERDVPDAEGKTNVLPVRGPGWEVVSLGGSGSNLLSSIEGYRKMVGTP